MSVQSIAGALEIREVVARLHDHLSWPSTLDVVAVIEGDAEPTEAEWRRVACRLGDARRRGLLRSERVQWRSYYSYYTETNVFWRVVDPPETEGSTP
jgi:hypothetical protein